MTTHEAQRCLEAGLEAVLEAGPIALEYFRQPMAVRDKRSGGHFDPVTEADRRIEALIRERLRRRSRSPHRRRGARRRRRGRGLLVHRSHRRDPRVHQRHADLGHPARPRRGRSPARRHHAPAVTPARPGSRRRGRARGCAAVIARPRCGRARTPQLADAVLYSTHPSMFRSPGCSGTTSASPHAAGCSAGAATATRSRSSRRAAST